MTTNADAAARHLAANLEKELGLGDNPPLRRALYLHLQLAAMAKPDQVLPIIKAAVINSKARARADRGRYFCKMVCRQLAEAGINTEAQDERNNSQIPHAPMENHGERHDGAHRYLPRLGTVRE